MVTLPNIRKLHCSGKQKICDSVWVVCHVTLGQGRKTFTLILAVTFKNSLLWPSRWFLIHNENRLSHKWDPSHWQLQNPFSLTFTFLSCTLLHALNLSCLFHRFLREISGLQMLCLDSERMLISLLPFHVHDGARKNLPQLPWRWRPSMVPRRSRFLTFSPF